MSIEPLDLEEMPQIPEDNGDMVKVDPPTPLAFTEDDDDKKSKKDKKKKEKKPRSLWERMFNKRKLGRPNNVAVIFLKNNRGADPMEVEVKNGFFNIKGKTYHENRDCLFTMGKERIPLAIIPEWSLIPVGTKDWDDKDMREKFAELQDHTLRGIRHAELVKMGDKDTKPMDMKKVIGIGVLLLIIGVVLYSYV